ncbi:MAG: anthrax toxin-like adenylyl cyclase domain-containing protein [Pseudomonadota bacterium]
MTAGDMEACAEVARKLNEVIIFRSTGPWAKRWIAKKFPTKNFHVKGKSSDWGPQAGFVPHNGIYSKVGDDPVKAQKGTDANNTGIHHSAFAVSSHLILTEDDINVQLTQKAEGRYALQGRFVLPNGNILLRAVRPGDGKMFSFLAKRDGTKFPIYVFPQQIGVMDPGLLMAHHAAGEGAEPLMIIGSAEVGAENRAMTGDYDLLAVCPPLSDRFSQVTSDPRGLFKKDDIHLNNGKASVAKGLEFKMGMGMDNVLDGRLHTAYDHRKSHVNARHGDNLHGPYQKGKEYDEHGDIGNVTPRILRAINMLNIEMGAVGDMGWARRVHHNAESHRFIDFGALSRDEMSGKKKEGFPFACFLPPALSHKAPMARYGTICTLEDMSEFEKFAQNLEAVNYWVPTNFTWGMKSRVAVKMERTIKKFEAMAAQNGGGFRGR